MLENGVTYELSWTKSDIATRGCYVLCDFKLYKTSGCFLYRSREPGVKSANEEGLGFRQSYLFALNLVEPGSTFGRLRFAVLQQPLPNLRPDFVRPLNERVIHF